MRIEIISCAIIAKQEEILLVYHNSESGSVPFWTLPGGIINKEESIFDGLTREIYEETGLNPNCFHQIAYCAQKVNLNANVNSIIFIFEIPFEHCKGSIEINDPDGDISDIRFFSIDEARLLLEQIPFQVMSEPIVDYLSNRSKNKPSFWLYKEDETGSIESIKHI